MKEHEMTVERKIWDNSNGSCLTVKPDGDALGLVEVDGGDDFGRVVVPTGIAFLLADAVSACAREIEQSEA